MIASWHRLWLDSGLGRYLIAFEPLTFVLDPWKRFWQMLSLLSVLRRSKNFTSNVAIRMPPSVPINHYLGVPKTNKIEPRSYSIIPCTQYSGEVLACFKHSNLFKVNVPAHLDTLLRNVILRTWHSGWERQSHFLSKYLSNQHATFPSGHPSKLLGQVRLGYVMLLSVHPTYLIHMFFNFCLKGFINCYKWIINLTAVILIFFLYRTNRFWCYFLERGGSVW